MDFNNQLSKASELLTMFLENKIIEVIEYLEDHSGQSIYFAYGNALIQSADAGIAFNPFKIKKAMNSLIESLKYTNSKRKRGLSKHIYVSNYNEFSDEQCHAELCYAEALLCYAAFLVVSDSGLAAFINAAADVKISHECYKLCSRILEKKTNWENEECKLHFESGVHFGIAGFELGFSFLPSKFRKLLPLIGFSGNRDRGLRMLIDSKHTKSSLRFPCIQALLFAYNVGFEHLFCLGESDTKIIADIVYDWEPKSEKFLVHTSLLAVYNHRIGNVQKAIELYEKCLKMTATIFPRLQVAFSIAIALCHSIEGNWELCVDCLRKNKKYIRWSPALFSYFYAVCLFMQMEDDHDDHYKAEISDYLRKVPSLKRKFGGHLAFHEKLVVKRSETYCDDVLGMILPVYELFYIWNYFPFIVASTSNAVRILNEIDKKMLSVTEEQSNFEGFLYLTFIKGVVLRHQNQNTKAIKCLNCVLNSKNKLKKEKHLKPQAALEMALIYKNDKNFEMAKVYLKTAKQYNNYLTDVMVKYRINCVYSSMNT